MLVNKHKQASFYSLDAGFGKQVEDHNVHVFIAPWVKWPIFMKNNLWHIETDTIIGFEQFETWEVLSNRSLLISIEGRS